MTSLFDAAPFYKWNQDIDFIDGAKISIAQAGSGDPVVLLHSSAASGVQWYDLSRLLLDRHRVIVPDQFGCGRSDPWPGIEPFSLAAEAVAVERIIDQLGAPVHLVGHSYGGGVALLVACGRMKELASLTLIEPSAFHLLDRDESDDKAHFFEISEISNAIREAVQSGDLQGGMARFVDYWTGAGAWARLSGEARAKLIGRMAKLPLDFGALFAEKTERADIARIDVPTLIIRGEASPGPSRRIVEILAETLPHCRVETIAGAGHMAPITHAKSVNAVIEKHLDLTSAVRDLAA